MPKKKNPCPEKISTASGETLTESESSALAARMQRLAQERAKGGENYEDALRDIAGTLKEQIKLAHQLEVRATLLDVRARRNIRNFVRQFDTIGEGLVAFMQGSNKLVPGARLSVSVQEKALHSKYIGRLVAELEQADLFRVFKSGDLSREIYTEMEELGKENGIPGSSGSKEALEIARIIEGVTTEMVARQNAAGANIGKLPGYVVRQTHDTGAIRRAGGVGNSPEKRGRSYAVWRDFTLPLLDTEETFKGADPEKFLRNVHEALYTGVHGPTLGEFENYTHGIKFDISKKASQSRVLHFKDADAAWQYNEKFGTRNLKDQVFSDLFYRSRAITLMENFGPRVEQNFDRLMRELREDARVATDADKQVDSLRDWRIQTLFDTVTGKTEIPGSYSLAHASNIVRTFAVLSKMGSVVLSALSDRVFLNHEAAYQGIERMQRWANQVTGMSKTPEQRQTLRLMGVAMDGIIGSTVSRYTSNNSVSGLFHRVQQKFFDLNFLNWWTDTSKGAAGQLFAAHLGEHSGKKFRELPEELSRVLSLYGFNEAKWDVARATAWVREGTDEKYVTPDKLKNLTEGQVKSLLEERGLKDTPSNRETVTNDIETSLRAYFTDRVDFAIPTPGAETYKYMTLGTRAGTPLGEAVRMLMMFKSFPITVATKILSREVYGHGHKSLADWVLNDHKGKFHTAQLVAMTMVAGYLSGAIKDALKGRTPKRLIDDDGKIVEKTMYDAAFRGGGLGIMGDFLFNEYGRQYRSAVSSLSGPVFSQIDPVMEALTMMKRGEYDAAADKTGKLLKDNTPFINLFYLRPVLDYFIFWNLQEMTDPGSLKRTEDRVRRNNNQDFWLEPSGAVR